MNLLVVAALPSELGNQFEHEQCLFTGIGKINATLALTRYLTATQHAYLEEVDLVVNFGTAGSAYYKPGKVVQCVRIYERDMVCHMPELEHENPILAGLFPHVNYKLAECRTGDQFLKPKDLPCRGVVDMEAYALAKVCKAFRVPFYCFKAVTDGIAGHNSEDEWRARISDSAAEFKMIYTLFKKGFSGGIS